MTEAVSGFYSKVVLQEKIGGYETIFGRAESLLELAPLSPATHIGERAYVQH